MDALRHNIGAFQRALPGEMNLMAVVKADAYGHGAVKVAQEAWDCGVRYIGVAFLDEGLELRRAGVTAPILVLGYAGPEGIRVAWEHDITLTVYSDELWPALDAIEDDAVAAPPHKLKVHIKLDTGMGRIGLQADRDEETIAFIERALQHPRLDVEGMYTHFACADETDKSYTLEQHRKFDRVVRYFREQGVTFRYLHTGNSATAIDSPSLSYNMIRLGISMYGLYPSEEVQKTRVELMPVMSIKTKFTHIKTLPPGSGVSYGAAYRTQGEETIATLPIGYADGYSRMLSGKSKALVRGVRVPVVGRICMDQCMLNVTGMDTLSKDEEVVLLGGQEEERITADELAELLGTINYEITCMLSHRVPRVYIRNGKTIDIVNTLHR